MEEDFVGILLRIPRLALLLLLLLVLPWGGILGGEAVAVEGEGTPEELIGLRRPVEDELGA